MTPLEPAKRDRRRARERRPRRKPALRQAPAPRPRVRPRRRCHPRNNRRPRSSEDKPPCLHGCAARARYDFVTVPLALFVVTLHLIKLCVGCDSVQDLEDWIREKLAERKKRKLSREHLHRTRMVPKRADELRDGGSLFWVIRGEVMCRQRLL